MSITIDSLLAALRESGNLFVYDRSADMADGTAAAIVKRGTEKLLAVMGEHADAFSGEEQNGVKLCPLSADNAVQLQALFPTPSRRATRTMRSPSALATGSALRPPAMCAPLRAMMCIPCLRSSPSAS